MQARPANLLTTQEHVVSPGQHVRIEFDLYDGAGRLEIYEPLNEGSALTWLDNKTALYHCPNKTNYAAGSRDTFMVIAPDGRFDSVQVAISPKYVQSPAQQGREATLPGSTGPDPRVAALEGEIADLKGRLAVIRRAAG